jgi:hypothetical protein
MVKSIRDPPLTVSAEEIGDLADRLAAHSRKARQPKARRDMALAAQMLRHLLPTGADRDKSRESAVMGPTHPGNEDPDGQRALMAAVAQMCDVLARISDVHARHPDMRRRAAIHAIRAIFAFVMRINGQQAIKLMAPLHDVSDALLELERGGVPPLFKVKRKRSRPADSSGREIIKGAAAAAMTFIMKAGLARKEAARRVADELHRGGVTLSGHRHLGWGTIASWRDQAMTAAPDGTRVARAYHIFMNGGRYIGPMALQIGMKLPPDQRDRFIRAVLRQLRKVIATQHSN